MGAQNISDSGKGLLRMIQRVKGYTWGGRPMRGQVRGQQEPGPYHLHGLPKFDFSLSGI